MRSRFSDLESSGDLRSPAKQLSRDSTSAHGDALRAEGLLPLAKSCLILLLLLIALPTRADDRHHHPHPPTPARDLLNEIDTIQSPSSTAQEVANPPRSLPHRWRLLQLFWPVLLTAAALAIAGSIAGLFVLLRGEALVALAMPQVVAIGVAIGLRMGWPTLPPAMVASAAGLMFFVAAKRRGAGHWVLPSLYVAGLSFSFLIIASHGLDVTELQGMFVGVDVAVSVQRALLAAPILLLTGIIVAALWRRWLVLAQAPAAAELAGLHPARQDALFLSLLTTILLLGTDSLGVVMALALLFLPAAAVLPWFRRIPDAMIAAAALGVALTFGGFELSNAFDWPFSQSVGGLGFVIVALSHLAARWRT